MVFTNDHDKNGESDDDDEEDNNIRNDSNDSEYIITTHD